jgi:DNA-binding YbaB/EbfC family protein
MGALLKQAQQMQQALAAAQEELANSEVTGSAGGELVTVTLTGSGDIVDLTISPAAVDPEDVETLQDLVVAAFRDAQRAVNQLAATTMGPVTGLSLPGL